MKKSVENITELLRSGIGGLTLKSDDFRFSELSMFAQLAASSETPLILVVGENLAWLSSRRFEITTLTKTLCLSFSDTPLSAPYPRSQS